MTAPHRRTRGLLATLALAACLLAGCTAGDWDYNAPPAAGVQADAGPVKARNIMAVTDGTRSALLGGIASSEDIELAGLTVAPEKADGSFGDPVPVEIGQKVGRDTVFRLDATSASIKDVELLPGRLARVTIHLADGKSLTLDAPVVSTQQDDYKDALER